MKIEEFAQIVATRVTETVVTEITNLPHMRWIQKQMESAEYSAWYSQLTEYAKEIGHLARNHYGVELTPEQVVVCVCNDCGDRNAVDFAYSLIHDRRHLARWVLTFDDQCP